MLCSSLHVLEVEEELGGDDGDHPGRGEDQVRPRESKWSVGRETHGSAKGTTKDASCSPGPIYNAALV